jgi:hypothetical protein
MKKIGLAALTAVLMMSGSAYAADIYKNGGLKDDESVASGKPLFTGLGVSVIAGGQFNNVNIADDDFAFDGIGADGVLGGVGLDYLLGFGNLRAGVYLEGIISNVNTQIEDGGDELDLLRQNHCYGGGLKGGLTAFRTSLLYVRGGVERCGWEFAEEVDVDVDSFVGGVGMATMLNDNWALDLNVDYVVPFNIEAEGHDLTELFEDSEGFRGMLRATWRR